MIVSSCWFLIVNNNYYELLYSNNDGLITMIINRDKPATTVDSRLGNDD